MTVIYVLRLEHEKYYIGKTDNLDNRVKDHQDGKGCAWTRLHPPVSGDPVVDVVHDEGFMELSTTLYYMKQYGIDNVRGADYVLPELIREQRKEIEKHVHAESGNCFRCGGPHFIAECEPGWKKTLWTALVAWFDCKKERVDTPGGETIITFGRTYNGKTYAEVYKNHRSYCEWLLKKPAYKDDIKRFQDWCRAKHK